MKKKGERTHYFENGSIALYSIRKRPVRTFVQGYQIHMHIRQSLE